MIIPINITRQGFPASHRNIQKLVSIIENSSILDMPVTFHKKIKSSGYGTQPSTLKFSKK